MSMETSKTAKRTVDPRRGSLPGEDADTAFYQERVARLSELLKAGKTAEAIFLANFTKWPRSSSTAFERANFNPYELRDRKGLWSTAEPGVSPLLDQIQYRGYFHDIVVNDLIRGLNSSGGKAIANVPVFGINGVLAIPDGASLPSGWNVPYFIEVKTGFDPPFTVNQQQVYPLMCAGGHAVSLDPRIAQLGLKPGELLPPMDIMVAHTYGPKLPMIFYSYCKEIGFGGTR